jgi:hypothetical protein
MPAQPTPAVAPYRSCIVCFKGDTLTALALQGSAEWCIAGLMRVGLDRESAEATFRSWAEDVLGCDPGMVPVGRVTMGVRLCRECAKRTGTNVGESAAGMPVYAEPER